MAKDKIYLTASNGVYAIDPDKGSADKILNVKKFLGLFRRKGYAFFGIDYHPGSGKVIVAFRERIKTKKFNKPTTDISLFAIDTNTHDFKLIAEICDIHDVHQIAIRNDLVFITDCGKNRVLVYDLYTQDKLTMINIGDIRDDVNHVNALYIESDYLYIGLNNRGLKESEILKVAIEDCFDSNHFQIDILQKSTKLKLKNIYHSHDIEKYGEDFLVCSSHTGDIYKATDSELLLHSGDWARGLSIRNDTLWIGSSEFAERKDRHNEKIDGKVKIFDLKPTRKLIETINLEGAGQVNDIIVVPQKNDGD